MAFSFSPKIVTDGLVLALDAANPRSYVSGSTVWTDLTANSYNGTLINGPTFSSTNGGSIQFDGTNDYVSLGTPAILNGLQLPLTITCWVYNNVTNNRPNNFQTIYGVYKSSNNLYSLFRIDNAILRYYTSKSTGPLFYQYQDAFNITANIWNFCAAVVYGSIASPIVRVHLNTDFKTFNYSTLSANPDLTTDFRLGNNQAVSTDEGLSGQISNFQIYNRALSAQEVLQNYNATKSRFNLT